MRSSSPLGRSVPYLHDRSCPAPPVLLLGIVPLLAYPVLQLTNLLYRSPTHRSLMPDRMLDCDLC